MDMNREIVKAGWMKKRSSFLHRWEKYWFVLYSDGNLSWFETPDSLQPKKIINMRAVCTGLLMGEQVLVSPPEEMHTKNCLLQILARDNVHIYLCAEDADDMKTWQLVLQEARVPGPNTGAVYPGTTVVYPQGVTHGPPGTTVVYPQAVTHMYSGYYGGGYPGYVISQPGQSVVTVPNAANGNTVILGGQPGHVIVEEPRYMYGRGYYGGGFYGGPYIWF
ncbi:pleckstrin homology domain-containing family B member 2-like [Dreissena polymorpha]|uniref:PH domain-containing protein n=1 Tax=Dreissena polymorpha TaxID=45954 RepID=A0A9D4HCZ6_DREPO|nr:pleckstrin homology domain-containing family B member 2-like [Dreissena polymorpha]XP_052250869.1 pleckstrin homology domain-containing family B member 2-like [Dreissena polymorpha]KAH3713428.1 hypothetical protein DPMN_073221 [Dreissena polymorpha]